MFARQFLSCTTQERLFQHLQHRLSPARRSAQQPLKEFVALVRGQHRVEVLKFLQSRKISSSSIWAPWLGFRGHDNSSSTSLRSWSWNDLSHR